MDVELLNKDIGLGFRIVVSLSRKISQEFKSFKLFVLNNDQVVHETSMIRTNCLQVEEAGINWVNSQI